MTDQNKQAGRPAKMRVLFTGYGTGMIENLMRHITGHYEFERCQARDNDLTDTLEKFRPHAIVICLQNEFQQDLNAYFVLQNDTRYLNLPILVIGRNEDCELFKKRVTVRNATVLGRPLNMDAFLPLLAQLAGDALALEELVTQEKEQEKEQEAQTQKQQACEPDLNAELGSLLEGKLSRKLERRIEQLTRMGGRKSILVVDDDVRMLNVIKLFLVELYDVTVVPSGKLALKFLSKKRADLVLLDYLMPELDGPAVLREIRTGSNNRNVPVLFLTGVADKDMVLKTLEFNPSGYLLKPITREALLERVTEVLLGL